METVSGYAKELANYFNAMSALDRAADLKDSYNKLKVLEETIPTDFEKKVALVVTAFNDMFAYFCPFNVGDRVQLTRTPVIEFDSSWYGSRHFLVEGSIATVKCCDWHMGYKGRFVINLEFDNESWVDEEGKVHLVAPDRRRLFGFGQNWITEIN